MAQGEFDLIQKYFCTDADSSELLVGNGDDAAVISLQPGEALVTCVDTIVAGVHFPEDVPIESIGHKALAVNISDIAAMGGVSKWATLALTLPEYDHDWLQKFASGFFSLAKKHGIKLIGGDTTRGPLTISVQLMGTVGKTKQLLRKGASIGDKIFVSGALGEAGMGLDSWQKKVTLGEQSQYFHDRLNYPQPQSELGESLISVASAAIDISDGLASDLAHVLNASGVGAVIYSDKIPCPFVSENFPRSTLKTPLEYALYSGDDYHLCFTVSPPNIDSLLDLPFTIYEIGEIVSGDELILESELGQRKVIVAGGYNHF